MHTAGGVVSSDALTQTIQLQNNAQAVITTAAAAKIYRSNGAIATQQICLQLEDNACLEWFPQVFDGAISTGHQGRIRAKCDVVSLGDHPFRPKCQGRTF